MLRLSLVHARPGMVLAMPVHHPLHPEVVLLKAGAPLDVHCIPRLRELLVNEVWIRYPGLEELIRFVSPEVLASYRDLTVCIGVALDTAIVQTRVDMDFYPYKRAVMSVIDRLIEHPHAAILVSELAGGDRPFVRHAGNTCVLSLLMGLKLEFYLVRERARLSTWAARDISGLGVGAMFHDIGMTRLDPETLGRWNTTRDETDEQWQKHTVIGHDLVQGDLDPAAAAVVLHHHQRFNGGGFPPRTDLHGRLVPLAGSDIHIFARIAACADLFDRLRNPPGAPRSDANASPPLPAVHALSQMLQRPYREWLDPVVFLALLAVAPAYPPGSMVEITGGRRAVVVDWSPEDPCRPVVEVLEDEAPSERAAAQRTRIDLRNSGGIEVTAIDGIDVRAHNFYPAVAGEFDLLRVGKAMVNAAPAEPAGLTNGKAATAGLARGSG